MPIDERLVKWSPVDQPIDDRMIQWVPVDSAKEDKQAKPSAALSKTDKIIKGMRDPIDAGAQLLTNALGKALPGVVESGNKLNNWLADKTGMVGRLPEGGVDQQVRDAEKAYQAARAAQGESGIDAYRMLGNLASPANIGAARLLAPAAGAGALGRVASGVAGGVYGGAATPVAQGDFGAEKAKQMALGAGIGGALPMVGSWIASVISPKASTNPNLALLKSEGVEPTIGQTLGGRWNALEEKLQSVPILGDKIANARSNVLDQFNSAAINRAVKPIGQQVEGVGQPAVAKAGNMISDAYEAGKNAMGGFKLDEQALNELSTVKQMAMSLPSKERNQFNGLLDTVQNEISPNGSLLADSWKRLDSKLGKEAGRFSKASDAYQNQLGDAVGELKNILFENAKRANPQAAQLIDNADAAWANLVRVEGAAKAGINAEGVFTPGQLNSSIRQADNSVRNRAVSRGTALMQDLGNAGQQVIGNKIPNSFTTDRALIAGGALGSYLVNPAIPAGLVAGAGLYTQPMQRLLNAALSSRPQAAGLLADKVKNAAPMLAPGLVQVPIGLLQ